MCVAAVVLVLRTFACSSPTRAWCRNCSGTVFISWTTTFIAAAKKMKIRQGSGNTRIRYYKIKNRKIGRKQTLYFYFSATCKPCSICEEHFFPKRWRNLHANASTFYLFLPIQNFNTASEWRSPQLVYCTNSVTYALQADQLFQTQCTRQHMSLHVWLSEEAPTQICPSHDATWRTLRKRLRKPA